LEHEIKVYEKEMDVTLQERSKQPNGRRKKVSCNGSH